MLCLFLGYRLFVAYAADVTKAEITGKGFKFKAERVGPGIFFAAFGAAVLVYSLISPVHISQDYFGGSAPTTGANGNGSLSTSTGQAFNYAGAVDVGGDAVSVAKQRLQSLVTVEQIAAMNSGDQASKLAQANIGIQALKAALIQDIFGKDRLVEWQALVSMRNFRDKELSDKLATDPKLRKNFQEIEDAVTKGF